MWSSIVAPQGPNLINNFLPSNGMKQQRNFSMFAPSFPIAPSKSFKNPNFVNNFNKYQNNLKPVDSTSYNNNLKNSCHNHIIDSIKEKCPDAIPSVEEQKNPPVLAEHTCDQGCKMCILNNSDSKTTHKQRKREHTFKERNRMGKKSRQNLTRKEICEMMLGDDNTNTQDLPNPSLHYSCYSTAPHSLILEDFIRQPPHVNTYENTSENTNSLDSPMPQHTEILATVVPERSCDQSVTDSEDSFIVFDHQGNEEKNYNTTSIESPRLRNPSLCESEDSFIIFEGDNMGRLENDDTYFESSSEESERKHYSDDTEESECDEVDSSFSIVNNKKVRFASADKLCEVHPMVKWSYAYQAARKGPWETYARDRCRFKERAYKVGRDIKHIFDPQHRDRIFRERFENL